MTLLKWQYCYKQYVLYDGVRFHLPAGTIGTTVTSSKVESGTLVVLVRWDCDFGVRVGIPKNKINSAVAY